MLINLTYINIFFLLLINVVNFFYFDNLVIQSSVNFLNFIFLLFFPGLVVIDKFTSKANDVAFKILIIVGLSLCFMLFGGLLLNNFLILVGIAKPLAKWNILLFYNLILTPILIYDVNKGNDNYVYFYLDFKSLIVFSIFAILPLLSTLSAIKLNNGYETNLPILLILIILGIILYIFIFDQGSRNKYYACIVYFISVSALMLFSLRSNYLNGWDINQEYLVFKLTEMISRWDVKNSIGNTYNACMSITIMPTIISKLILIKDVYIYKLIYQLIFALTPVSLYLLFKRYVSSHEAFFSTMIFVSQTWFIEQMPALMRQEIAFFFISLFYLILYNNSNKNRDVLLLLSGLVIILSHYSSSYIWLFVIIATHVVKFFYKRIKKININEGDINTRLLVIFLLFNFFWNIQFTETGNSFKSFLHNSINQLHLSFTKNNFSEASSELLFRKYSDMRSDLQLSYRDVLKKKVGDASEYYKISEETSVPIPIYNIKLVDSLIPNELILYIDILYSSLRVIFVIIFPTIGLLMMLYRPMVKIPITYLFESIIGTVLIGFILLLPLFKLNYNLTRLYMQVLINLSLINFLGGKFIMGFIKKRGHVVLCFFLVAYFLYSYGVIAKWKGRPISVVLNTTGGSYDYMYTFAAEVKSAEWFDKNRDPSLSVYADSTGHLKLRSHAYVTKVITILYPNAIKVNSYIYMTKNNMINNISYVAFRNQTLSYQFPKPFVDNYKNSVYNNGYSAVYR